MVDSDTDSKSKDSNVNCQSNPVQTSTVIAKQKSVSDESLRTSSQSLPSSNTQIPGQFNYHPQQYKRIPEDNSDSNVEINQSHQESNHILACYKESPPSLLNDIQKKQSFHNGNGGNVNGADNSSDAEKFGSSVSVNTTAHISKADFETAIELTGYGKFHYLLLAICGLVSTSEEMDVISMSFILPSAQCDLDLNTQTKGWLNSIIFIGMMVGAYVWGSIADTVGRRKVLIVISFMNAVCIVASSFSQSYSLFMIFRFLNGVA